MKTHLDIMNLWPSTKAMADDLPVPTPRETVRRWKRVGHIPPTRYDDVIAAAAKRGFKGVTYPLLANTRPC